MNDKTILAQFLDLAEDYLRDGYARERKEPVSLPLAYLVEEGEEETAQSDDTDSGASMDSLEAIASMVSACSGCGLGATRTMAVPGEGVNDPQVMVIGEGPGADEDRTGRPFVGRAGQLLDKMLASIGLSRKTNCFIANMVKCRPPGNRDPATDEIAACFPNLERQIALLRPKIILCAGRIAAQALLKTSRGINALRGEFTSLQINASDGNSTGDTGEELNIPVLCTFHPSAILRDESLKRPAWEDLKLLKSHLDEV